MTFPRSFTSALNYYELEKLSAIAFQFEDSRFREPLMYPIPLTLNGEPCALFVEFVPVDDSSDRSLHSGDLFLARRPDFWTALVIGEPRHAYLSRGEIPIGSATKWPNQITTAIPARGRTFEEILNPYAQRWTELWNAGVVYTPEIWREIEPLCRDTFHVSVCDALADIITYIHETLSVPGSLEPQLRIDVSSLESS